MAIGSGLGSQIGFSAETAWGTRVAPSKFLRGKSYNLNREQNRVQGEGIQSGVLGQLGAHYVETTEGGSGSISFDVAPVGIGVLLQALTGGTSTCVQQAATTAWLQTHTLGDPVKSLTVQAGVPYRGGTVYCEELTGAKVTSAEFSCQVGDILSSTFNFDAKKWDNSQTLATASYTAQPALPVFTGKHLTVKTGAFGAEAAVTGMVRGMSLTWTNAFDTEDYTAGSTGLKSEQIRNGAVTITGTITTDWVTGAKTTFEDLKVANTSTSLAIDFTGPIIAAANAWNLQFQLPGVFFNGDAPAIQGPDVVTVDYGFEWKYDGTNLPLIKLMSTDVAL